MDATTHRTIPPKADLVKLRTVPAKMPESRIAKPPVILSDSTEDEVFITYSDVVVDEKDRSTYIENNAKIRQKACHHRR
jgi:hypothetical protein